MLRPLAVLTGLAVASAPVAAQVGLASPARSLQLTATRHGSVGVGLGSVDLAAGPSRVAPVSIDMAWDPSPGHAAAVSLVAYTAGVETLSGSGAPLVLFTRSMAAGTLRVVLDSIGGTEPLRHPRAGTLYLMAVTQ